MSLEHRKLLNMLNIQPLTVYTFRTSSVSQEIILEFFNLEYLLSVFNRVFAEGTKSQTPRAHSLESNDYQIADNLLSLILKKKERVTIFKETVLIHVLMKKQNRLFKK